MGKPEPLFLARQNYRRRRVGDAARLIPILGAFLFFLLLLMSDMSVQGQILYLFITWLGLICASFLLSRSLTKPDEATSDSEEHQ